MSFQSNKSNRTNRSMKRRKTKVITLKTNKNKCQRNLPPSDVSSSEKNEEGFSDVGGG